MSSPEALRFVSAAVADASKLTDWLTAVGTVGLALVTVITVMMTVWITKADRERDDRLRAEDRADAERRLQEERQAADQRLRDERDHAEAVRRREWQVGCALRLLERVAYLLPLADEVPMLGFSVMGADRRQDECSNAIQSLRHGLHADAPAIANQQVVGQYRTLVRLVDAIRGRPFGQASKDDIEHMGNELRRYAIFVRLSLERFIECGNVWDPGKPSCPVLRFQAGGDSLWQPEHEPPGWREALASDPSDPWYEALHWEARTSSPGHG